MRKKDSLLVGQVYRLRLDDGELKKTVAPNTTYMTEDGTDCVYLGRRKDEVLEVTVHDFAFHPQSDKSSTMRLSLYHFVVKGREIFYSPSDPTCWHTNPQDNRTKSLMLEACLN